MEHIYVDEVVVPHRVIEIRGDGACLFSSLSFLLYGTATLGEEVRTSVVQHVSNNWRRFKVFTVMPNGDPYRTKPLYLAEMSKPETFGTTCELMAAGEMFPYEFQVYRDGTLLAKFGQPVEGVKRLRFTGNLLSGHFDVLIPQVEQPIRTPPQPIPLPSIVDPSGITEIIPSRFSESDELPQVNVMCDSRRGKKRRARFTDCDRRKRNKMAVQKYSQKNPEVHRASVRIYAEKNPEVHRASVRIYSEKNPEVHRASVRIYSEKNPEVNRASVAKYRKANPEINRASVRKYYDKRREIKLLPWSVKSLSGFRYDRNIDYNHDKTVSIGERTVCKWCHAFKWKEEYPGMCCSNGKVQLLRPQNPPELLHSLLTDQHPHSEHFLTSIRKYNSCFQMTSFGAKEVREGNFMPTFKIQGQVYHRIGSLIPAPQQQPSFLQIYFVEGDKKERDIRCGNFPDVKPELVGQLQNMLHEHNQYVKDFKAAIECVDKDQKEFKVVINAEKKPPLLIKDGLMLPLRRRWQS